MARNPASSGSFVQSHAVRDNVPRHHSRHCLHRRRVGHHHPGSPQYRLGPAPVQTSTSSRYAVSRSPQEERLTPS